MGVGNERGGGELQEAKRKDTLGGACTVALRCAMSLWSLASKSVLRRSSALLVCCELKLARLVSHVLGATAASTHARVSVVH